MKHVPDGIFLRSGMDRVLLRAYKTIGCLWIYGCRSSRPKLQSTSFRIFLNEKVLQAVVSKDPIPKIVVDLNIIYVGLYRQYYNNGRKEIAKFQWRTIINPRYDPLPFPNKLYLEMERKMHILIQIKKLEKIELSIPFPILSLCGYE